MSYQRNNNIYIIKDPLKLFNRNLVCGGKLKLLIFTTDLDKFMRSTAQDRFVCFEVTMKMIVQIKWFEFCQNQLQSVANFVDMDYDRR